MVTPLPRPALTHYRVLLERCRSRGNPTHTASALANLGDCLRGLDRQEEAFAALDESLRSADSWGT
ncbi:tetratricopeptide repeat protein [Kitasatospora sp. NPDC096077]|uniref:tetratricopeptide repeat protein n=1 Tax=Kitasatospora sp. NPDC096077 TaxID=3155544 RepID=UPI00331E07FC